MGNRAIGVLALGVAAAITLTACSSSTKKTVTPATGGSTTASTGAGTTSIKGEVGVILPDTVSSTRWEDFDKPLLTKAFQAAGVKFDIQNALGDKNKMITIANSMITEGVSVLAIVNLDSVSGAQIEATAKQHNVKTIDYDRLTLGGSANYYVSFDNTKVGVLQGQGLVSCLTAKNVVKPQIIELNGSPTDNNATLFAQGYDSVLNPLYKAGTYIKAGDQSVPNWDNTQAGTIFEQLLTANHGKVDGVLAANDGLGNAAIQILKKDKLQVPVTGQDDTVLGLQHILDGDQCMTVYKPINLEASALAGLAIDLLQGKTGTTNGTVKDTQTGREVPSELLTPISVTKANIDKPVSDGFVKYADLCTAAYVAKCTAAGVTQ
jgi:D-xylose transport system substrate-binding protein